MTPTSRPTDDAARGAPVLGVAHTRPASQAPRGSCDCHVHVFGPQGRYTLAEDRVFMPDAATVDDLVQLHMALQMDRAVVVQASPQGTDNTCLTDTLLELQQRGREARGVAVVSKGVSDAMLAALHTAGVRGLRVNLQSYGTSDPAVARRRLLDMADIATKMGWHIQIYTHLGVLDAIAEDIVRLSVPVVIDHFGLAQAWQGTAQRGFAALLALARDGHAYVKLSAPYRIVRHSQGEDGIPIVRALIESNVDRMLWGTDWPHTHHQAGLPRLRDQPEPFQAIDDGCQLNFFLRCTSSREREKIFVDNPEVLYGFAVEPPNRARA